MIFIVLVLSSDCSLKQSTSKSSGWRSRYRSRIGYSDRRESCTCRNEENLKVLHPVNDFFSKAVYYRTNHLADLLTEYARPMSKYTAKMAKPMSSHMKPHVFNPSDSIRTVVFWKYFKFVCDTKDLQKGAVLWVFRFFMEKTAFALLNACLSADGASKRYSWWANGKTRYFSTYPQVFNFLPKKYETDEVILETISNSTPFRVAFKHDIVLVS